MGVEGVWSLLRWVLVNRVVAAAAASVGAVVIKWIYGKINVAWASWRVP